MDAKAMLREAGVRLLGQFPVKIQVSGVPGEIDGRMPRRVRSAQLEAGGFPPEWSGVIVVSFEDASAAGWQPLVNHRLSVDGEQWLVSEVQTRSTSYVLRLQSPDE